MKPDALLTWPVNCDYPLWRGWLARDRGRLGRVLVCMSPHAGRDLSGWTRPRLEALGVQVLDPEPDGEWRDRAVNRMLDLSDSEWVWFTEQDLEITDPILWGIFRGMAEQGAEMMGVRRDQRWHPCCLLVKRARVDATTRYFGPEPVDHFYTFGRELEAAGTVRSDLEAINPRMLRHLAGLSRNHQIIEEGPRASGVPLKPQELYHRDEFADYLRRCLASGAELEEGWERRARGFLRWLESEEGAGA